MPSSSFPAAAEEVQLITQFVSAASGANDQVSDITRSYIKRVN